MRLRLAAGVVLMAALAGPARADQPSPGSDPGGCEALRTVNTTHNKIWVTVYDAGHLRHLDYGWVDPCSIRVWRSGSYACGSYYHVRAEVKRYDVSQGNFFDTQVETNPQWGSYKTFAVSLRRHGDSYYWEHGNTAGCTPTGMTACCANDEPLAQGDPAVYKTPPPPPAPPAKAELTFGNAAPGPVMVVVYTADDPKLHEECVPAKTARTWSLKGAWEYRVRATPHRQSCEDAAKLRAHAAKATLSKDGRSTFKFLYDATERGYRFDVGPADSGQGR